jgi:acetyl esterase/lipase
MPIGRIRSSRERAGATHEPWHERLVAGALRLALRTLLMPTFRPGRPVGEQRRRLERIGRLMPAPRGVTFEAGRCGGVRGEFVRTSRPPESPGRVLLYLHGGAYCLGSPATHRAIAGRLARLTGSVAFVADYRLAPEHPFPAALDDAVAAYRGLLELGHGASDISIVGDSAGAGLTLATAVALRDAGLALPRALVAFSPWVDLGQVDRGAVPPGEVMISPAWVAECAGWYLGGRESTEPLASPIHADLRGLPPTLIQVGMDEVLLPDSRRLHAALVAAGVVTRLETFPRRWHVFQANAGVLADADRALASVARFIEARG